MVGTANVAVSRTLSIVGRCPRTGAIGTCVASSSVAIGSRCPYVALGVAALASQGFTNPRLGPLALDLLGAGLLPGEVLDVLRQHDRWIAYRQIGIVPQKGDAVGYTGNLTSPWSGHLAADSFVCLGNGLAGREPLEAAAAAFGASREAPLEKQLIGGLVQAGKLCDAQHGLLSASILVLSPSRRNRLDLRVDIARPSPEEGGDAVAELRSLLDRFEPLIGYYEAWHDNPELGDWREWERRTQLGGQHPNQERRSS